MSLELVFDNHFQIEDIKTYQKRESSYKKRNILK